MTNSMWVVVTAVVLMVQVVTAGRDYSSYKIIKATPTHDTGLQFLRRLETEENNDQMDFLSRPLQLNIGVDIRVHSDDITAVKSRFNLNLVNVEVVVDNLQSLIDLEQELHPQFSELSNEKRKFNLTTYNSYDDIIKFITKSCEESDDDDIYCEMVLVGKTTEGRDIMSIMLSLDEEEDLDNYDDEDDLRKPIMFLEAGIHAREWIAPASMVHFINQLFKNETLRNNILGTYDVYLTPSSNPDGYTFSREHERLWRKTRSLNKNSNCVGTDPNRNFDALWSGPGSSPDPCSNVYQGTKAFSEPETRAMADLMLSFEGRMHVYVAVHSYSQMWLIPYAYSYAVPKNYDDMHYVARETAIAHTAASGYNYTFGQTSKVLYLCAGGSDDYAYDGGKATYSYTVELPDTGHYGFALPSSEIHRVGNGLTKSIEALVKAVSRRERNSMPID